MNVDLYGLMLIDFNVVKMVKNGVASADDFHNTKKLAPSRDNFPF